MTIERKKKLKTKKGPSLSAGVDLLCCPFCGSDAVLIQKEDNIGCIIGCKNGMCFAFVSGNEAEYWVYQDEAIEKWNRRDGCL